MVSETLYAWTQISNMLRMPHWPFRFVVAFGSALFSIVLLIQAVEAAPRREAQDVGGLTMSPEWIGFLGILAMLFLLTMRMPIGIAMLLVGSIGFAILNGPPAGADGAGHLSLFLRRRSTISPSFRCSC